MSDLQKQKTGGLNIMNFVKGSRILEFLYENVIKNITKNIPENKFLSDKNNTKYIVSGIAVLCATSLMAIMSYFLFYAMFFFSSLKCILWLFEQYDPEQGTNEEVEDKYVSETSPSDVLEYYIVPIFIVIVMYPLAYIPIPFVSTFIYGGSIMLALASTSSKMYRQKICVFIRDLFVTRQNGKFISGTEGEVHKMLQTLCYTLECINFSAFNITHKPRAVYDKLDKTETIFDGLKLIADLQLDSIGEKIKSQYVKESENKQIKMSSKFDINDINDTDNTDDELDEN